MFQNYVKTRASRSGFACLAFLWVMFFFAACFPRKAEITREAPPAADSVSVSGRITQTSSYCGGARPPDEILEEYNKPKPYTGKSLFVIEGDKVSAGNRVIKQLTADDTGHFHFMLPRGHYAIVQEEQLKPLNIRSYNNARMVEADSVCLEKWWKEPLVKLHVQNKALTGITINFHHPCFVSGDVPCLRYVGPMPP